MKRVKWLLLFSLILNVIGLVFFVIGFSTHFWLESDKNYRTSSGFESVSTRVPVKLCHNVGPRCFIDKFRLRIKAIPIVILVDRLLITLWSSIFLLNSGNFFIRIIGLKWWVIRLPGNRELSLCWNVLSYFHFTPKCKSI